MVRSLGPYATVAAVLAKLETLHGAVAPLDVMMRKPHTNQARGASWGLPEAPGRFQGCSGSKVSKLGVRGVSWGAS